MSPGDMCDCLLTVCLGHIRVRWLGHPGWSRLGGGFDTLASMLRPMSVRLCVHQHALAAARSPVTLDKPSAMPLVATRRRDRILFTDRIAW